MYTLTLTKSDREAFDWVGGRYATGACVADILSECTIEEYPWDYDGPVTFKIPEHKAWEIAELSEQEDGLWPCFAPSLREKMQSFVDSIV